MSRNLSVEDARFVVKAALRRAAKRAGGATALAIDLDLSEGHLSNCQNPDKREMIGAHQILVIDSLVGSPVMLEPIAREAGYMLIKRDKADPGQLDMTDLLRFIGDSGDLSKSLSSTLEDGIVDACEARINGAKIDTLIARLHDLRDKMDGGGR